MSDFQTSAGATISISAAVPATYDEAGYEALTYTPCTAAEITNYDPPIAEWSKATDNSWNDADKADIKSSRKLGEGSITIQYDKTNTAFWSIVDAAELSKTSVVSIQFANANGVDLRWYTAQITKSAFQYGGADDIILKEVMVLAQTDYVDGTV